MIRILYVQKSEAIQIVLLLRGWNCCRDATQHHNVSAINEEVSRGYNQWLCLLITFSWNQWKNIFGVVCGEGWRGLITLLFSLSCHVSTICHDSVFPSHSPCKDTRLTSALL